MFGEENEESRSAEAREANAKQCLFLSIVFAMESFEHALFACGWCLCCSSYVSFLVCSVVGGCYQRHEASVTLPWIGVCIYALRSVDPLVDRSAKPSAPARPARRGFEREGSLCWNVGLPLAPLAFPWARRFHAVLCPVCDGAGADSCTTLFTAVVIVGGREQLQLLPTAMSQHPSRVASPMSTCI